MDFLSECTSCRNIIKLKEAICPICRAFQLYIDEEIEEKKFTSISLMSERKYLCQQEINRMYDRGESDDAIQKKLDDFYRNEVRIKKMIQKKIDKVQKYLLN